MKHKKGGNNQCECKSNECDTLTCKKDVNTIFSLGVRKIGLEMFRRINKQQGSLIKAIDFTDHISPYLPNLKNKNINDFIPILLDIKRLGDRSKIEYVKEYN